MKTELIFAGALVGLLLISSGAGAREWFDDCTITASKGDGTKFVGGPANKPHLHVGNDFIDDTRNPTGLGGRYTTNIKKTQLKNKCESLGQWRNAIVRTDKSQYESPEAVFGCLGIFMDYIGCEN